MCRILSYSAIFAMALSLLLFPHLSVLAVQKALSLCIGAIIPSLFPYMALANIWYSLDGSQWLSQKLRPFMKSVFHLPGEAACAMLLGCVSGFPVSAKITAMLYNDHQIEKHEAEHMLMFCSNAGPAFVFGVIGRYIFKSSKISFALWLTHIVSAVIIGILFRPRLSQEQQGKALYLKNEARSSASLTQSIIDAGNSVIQICLLIIFFSILIEFTTAIIPPQLRSSSLFPFLVGLLELTNGVSAFPHQPTEAVFVMMSALLAWNGCCIHMQVLSVTSKSQLKMKKYFAGKFLHMLLSTAVACMIAPFLPFEVPNQPRFKHMVVWIAITFILFLIFHSVAKTSSGKSIKLSL